MKKFIVFILSIFILFSCTKTDNANINFLSGGIENSSSGLYEPIEEEIILEDIIKDFVYDDEIEISGDLENSSMKILINSIINTCTLIGEKKGEGDIEFIKFLLDGDMGVYDYIIENDIKNPILTKEIKSFFKNSDDEDIFYGLLYSLGRIDKGEYIKIENEFIDNLKGDNKRLDDGILFDQDIISTFIRDTFLDKNDSTYCLDIILTFGIE